MPMLSEVWNLLEEGSPEQRPALNKHKDTYERASTPDHQVWSVIHQGLQLQSAEVWNYS